MRACSVGITDGRPSWTKPTWLISASSRIASIVARSCAPRLGRRRSLVRGVLSPWPPPRPATFPRRDVFDSFCHLFWYSWMICVGTVSGDGRVGQRDRRECRGRCRVRRPRRGRDAAVGAGARPCARRQPHDGRGRAGRPAPPRRGGLAPAQRHAGGRAAAAAAPGRRRPRRRARPRHRQPGPGTAPRHPARSRPRSGCTAAIRSSPSSRRSPRPRSPPTASP